MVAVDVLSTSVLHTHDVLVVRLETARSTVSTPGQPRKAYEGIDTFLALASQHLNAVDAALLPAARKQLPDGSAVVHDYLHAARTLEVSLAHVKARAYGSTFEAGHHWQAIWADVARALAAHRRSEADLVDRLAGVMDARSLDAITERLHHAETVAPTRPHPYTPHTGFPGLVARKVMHAVDLFWDTAEGRMSPTKPRPPRKRPGIVTQYFLADPRFDEDEPERRDPPA